MKNKTCIGCGEKLQTEDKEKVGYVPLEKYLMQENLVCRRCFRLKNYGEVPDEIDNIEEYKSIIKKSINNVDYVMAIFDIIDLESSMDTEIIDILQEVKSIAVLNKIDLLPKYYTASEISQWFSKRLTDENVFPETYCYVSTKNHFGINGILRKIKDISEKKEIKIAVIGASNVGKSSILNKLLANNKLTVSKYSGTTKESIKTSIKYKDIKITFIDTPGLIPKGRMGDLLPKYKAVKLVPNKEISRKTFKLSQDQYFMFSNLVYFKVLEKTEIQVFASADVQFHVTNEKKVKDLLQSNYFELLNEEETQKYLSNEFITEKITIEKGNDLVILGLGFVELKKNSVDIELTYPKNAKYTIRESISKVKRIEEEEYLW